MFTARAVRRRKRSIIRRSFRTAEVLGFDYRAQTPWEAKAEFPQFFEKQRKQCDRLTLAANSIGAFFSMSSLDEALVDQARISSLRWWTWRS